MDLEYKELWTAALRSGKFEQGKGVLARLPDKTGETPIGYCCLGVLCEIYAQRTGRMRFTEVGHDFWRTREYIFEEGPPSQWNSSRTDLPESFRDLIGITYDQQNKLVDLNDEQEYNFVEIADWIDENL